MRSKFKLRNTGLMILIFSLFTIYSCTKTDNAGTSKEQSDVQSGNNEAIMIDEKNFAESDEDFTTIDYKEIYDRITSQGEWVQVKPEEIGMKPGTAFFEDPDSKGMTLSGLIGIKDSYAETAADAGMIYVWKPSLELGIPSAAGGGKIYTPYTNGQWINSDAGWYFKAPTPVEETVSHYGRWINSPSAGWLWVPGRVWSPAWVDWKQNDNYVSWAPLPPSVYLDKGTINNPLIADNNYVIVDRKFFLEPDVYKYSNIYPANKILIPVNNLTRTEGVSVVNNTVVNKGPDVNLLRALYGRNIETVRLQPAASYSEVRYAEREYFIFKPVFKRFKQKGRNRIILNTPGSYKRYDEWNNKTYKGENEGKPDNDINGKKNDDNSDGKNNGNKHDAGDNGNKNNESENRKVNKHNDNEYNNKNKGSRQKDNDSKNKDGSDKNSRRNGDDNSNSNNGNHMGNDNGNSKDGNNNGKGKK